MTTADVDRSALGYFRGRYVTSATAAELAVHVVDDPHNHCSDRSGGHVHDLTGAGALVEDQHGFTRTGVDHVDCYDVVTGRLVRRDRRSRTTADRRPSKTGEQIVDTTVPETLASFMRPSPVRRRRRFRRWRGRRARTSLGSACAASREPTMYTSSPGPGHRHPVGGHDLTALGLTVLVEGLDYQELDALEPSVLDDATTVPVTLARCMSFPDPMAELGRCDEVRVHLIVELGDHSRSDQMTRLLTRPTPISTAASTSATGPPNST